MPSSSRASYQRQRQDSTELGAPLSPPLPGAELAPLVSSSFARPPMSRESSIPMSIPPAVPRPQRQTTLSDVGSLSSDLHQATATTTPAERQSFLCRDSSRMSTTFEDLTPEIRGISQGSTAGREYSRYSGIPTRSSIAAGMASSSTDAGDTPYDPPGSRLPSTYFQDSPGSRSSTLSAGPADMVRSATTDALLWDEKNAEQDDYLHNPDPGEFRRDGHKLRAGKSTQDKFRPYSLRGLSNVFAIFVILGGIIALFALWPIITEVRDTDANPQNFGWNIGGTNSSGQVPEIPNFPSLIDRNTPDSAKTWKNMGGEDYVLVFSDEFNEEGRSFYPGDDPFWEGVDLNYWATVNYEWVHPDALTTHDGNLEITMTEQPIHDLSFRSGFLQSWNKFCFNEAAYVEVNLSLPGEPDVIGFWPGVWSMGNLGRAGYGATNDGTWPYSYDSCDVGTLANQTNPGGGPEAAETSGSRDYGGALSWLPGQKLSACTCPGDPHPGPSNDVGRSAPEIDILEAQVDYRGYGTGSQSVQIAPFDPEYLWHNVTGEGYDIHYDNCSLNDWKGSITQESASGVGVIGTEPYSGRAFTTFGYDYQSGRDDGYITWYMHDDPSWTLYADGFRANEETQVDNRLISEEPMYLMLNLFISSKFQGNPDFGNLEFPATMYIDYVRVYQPRGAVNVGCDPSSHPTADYIQDHIGAYTNINYTTWQEAGYQWPRNSMAEGGCDVERAGP